MDRPFFTVVMATYDRGRHILPSVRSVLAQDWRDFELLVVGDGCTDDTGAVLKEAFGDRLRWMNLPERRGSQSFPNNAGIAAGRGSHIAYLGHDDLWGPDHLSRLAAVFQDRPEVDIAVSGSAFHLPHGMAGPFVNGLFDDAETPRTQFFPPSSFAHRRDMTDRIGPWRDPFAIHAPVDCDLLLRAVAAGLCFASTGAITAHKFAAGHRYLSYLWHDTDEQEAVLARLAAPDRDAWIQSLVDSSRAAGRYMSMPYFDFQAHGPGDIARNNLKAKGLRATAEPLEAERTVPVAPVQQFFDWQGVTWQGFLWPAGNPRPRVLLPFCGPDEAVVVIEFAHTSPDGLRQVTARANGRMLAFRMAPALPKGGIWTAAGQAVVPLQPEKATAIELQFDPLQRPGETGGGLAHGRITALPLPDADARARAEADHALGLKRRDEGDLRGAAEAFRAAVAASPLHGRARGALSLVHAELGHATEAAEQAIIATALEPAQTAPWVALARVELARIAADPATAGDGAADRVLVIGALLDGMEDGAVPAYAVRSALAALQGENP